MPPDDWDRIQSVFLSVADLPPDERVGRLDAECGDDKEFRAEDESLLASDGGSAQTISAAIADETALLGDDAKGEGNRQRHGRRLSGRKARGDSS